MKQLISLAWHRLLCWLALSSWPTKPYEFWMILQMLLYFSQPRTIVELGSGRSTHYFAEYALKKRAKFLSVEQKKSFFLRNRIGLKLAFLPDNVMSRVPVVGGWYSEKKLQKEMDNRGIDAVEFLLIDGPGGVANLLKLGYHERNVPQCEQFIQRHAPSLRCIVFDDLNRASYRRLYDTTAAAYNMERYMIGPEGPRSIIGFLLPRGSLVATQFQPPFSSLVTRLE